MSTLIKVIKTDAVSNVGRFVMPEVGVATLQAGTLNFSYPRMDVPAANVEVKPAYQPGNDEAIAEAQAMAEQIIADAENQAEMIRQAAEEKGLREARVQLSLEVAEQAAELRQKLAETIETISGLYGDIASRAENEIVELALEISKKIVQREVTIDREIALTLVRVALGRLHNRAVATVHLHPEDLAYINSHRDKLNFHGSIELVEDRSIGLGGCLVRTEMGDIDARISEQFDEISRGLLGVS